MNCEIKIALIIAAAVCVLAAICTEFSDQHRNDVIECMAVAESDLIQTLCLET